MFEDLYNLLFAKENGATFWERPWVAASFFVLVLVSIMTLWASSHLKDLVESGERGHLDPSAPGRDQVQPVMGDLGSEEKGTPVQLGESSQEGDRGRQYRSEATPLYEKQITSVLLILYNSLEEKVDRGPALAYLLLSINQAQGTVKMISLSPEMAVFLPKSETLVPLGELSDKLSSAEVLGLLGDYLSMDLMKLGTLTVRDLEELIDLLGGIDLDIEPGALGTVNRLILETNQTLAKTNQTPPLAQAGLQSLQGRQVGAYVRDNLDPLGSLGSQDAHMARQRLVMQAVLYRLLDLDNASRLELVEPLLDLFQINFDPNDFMTLLATVLPALDKEIGQMALPLDGYAALQPGDPAPLRCNFAAMVPAIQNFLYGKTYVFLPGPEIPGAPVAPETRPEPLPDLVPPEKPQK